MDTTKIVSLIPLLASDKDGEALGAVRAIGRVLKSQGKDWHDFASLIGKPADPEPQPASKPPWDDEVEKRYHEKKANKKSKKESAVAHHVRVVMKCKEKHRQGPAYCSFKELSFLESMLEWTGKPTDKQWDWLDAISHKLGFDSDSV